MSPSRLLQNLPPDVWVNIFMSITDLKTLNRTIQASKEANRTFKQYTRTIMTAVAHTEVGPALSSALLYALVLQKVRSEGIESHFDVWKNEAVRDLLHTVTEDTAGFSSSADWNLAKEVAVNAELIGVCEEFYSRKLCDVTSCDSVLSPAMSERLQRALYRFFLYRLITFGEFHWNRTIRDMGYDPSTLSGRVFERLYERNEEERERYEKPRRPLKLQFFSRTFKTDEEREDFAAAVNLLETCFSPWFNNIVTTVDGGSASSDAEYWMELSTLGPILKHSRESTGTQKEWSLKESAKISSREMTHDVCKLLEIDRETLEWDRFVDISQERVELILCAACNKKFYAHLDYENGAHSNQEKEYSCNIYNESNWGMLYGDMPPSNFLRAIFPLKLQYNAVEGPSIAKSFRSLYVPQTIHLIFKSAHARGEKLSEKDWVCFECLMAFLRKQGLVWWEERRRRKGYSVPSENCRKGFQCDDQQNKAHAEKYNHFCFPDEAGNLKA